MNISEVGRGGMSNILQTILTFALAVFPWFFPDWELFTKITVTLLIFFLSCVFYCIILILKIRRLEAELKSVQDNRDALAHQFDEKNEIIRKYRNASLHMLLTVHMACCNPKSTRLKELYKNVSFILDEVNDDGGM